MCDLFLLTVLHSGEYCLFESDSEDEEELQSAEEQKPQKQTAFQVCLYQFSIGGSYPSIHPSVCVYKFFADTDTLCFILNLSHCILETAHDLCSQDIWMLIGLLCCTRYKLCIVSLCVSTAGVPGMGHQCENSAQRTSETAATHEKDREKGKDREREREGGRSGSTTGGFLFIRSDYLTSVSLKQRHNNRTVGGCILSVLNSGAKSGYALYAAHRGAKLEGAPKRWGTIILSRHFLFLTAVHV